MIDTPSMARLATHPLAQVSTCVCVGDKGGRIRCSRRRSKISVGAACLLHEEKEGAEPRRRQELLLWKEIGHVGVWKRVGRK
jgi:hypothetical protein